MKRVLLLIFILCCSSVCHGAVVQKRITSFSAGELSPKMMARVDFAKYSNGLELLENFVLLPQGGIQSRSGLRYVAETKDSTVKSRLIRFVFNITDVYMLEFGNQYIRFYKDGAQLSSGGSPVEISTPYLTSDLPNIKFAQSNDVMYLVDGRNSIRKLSRISDTNWTLSVVPGNPPPSFRKAQDLAQPLTPTNVTGNDIDFISVDGTELVTNGTFDTDLTGWDLDNGTGSAPTASGSKMLLNNGGSGKSIGEQNVTVVNATEYILKFSITGTSLDVAIGSTTGGFDIVGTATFAVGTHTVSYTSSGTSSFIQFINGNNNDTDVDDVELQKGTGIFLAADVDKEILSGGAIATIKTIDGTSKVIADITSDFPSTDVIASGGWTMFGSPSAKITPDKQGPVGGSVALTLDTAGWRSTDVGKFVKMSNGYIELNNFGSSTVMNGIVKHVLDNTTAVESGLWTLNDNSWSTDNGFPNAIAFHGQGLWFAGTTQQPRTIWRSSFFNFEDFNAGVSDDDSIDKTIATRDPILWLSSFRDLIIGTLGAELLAGASPTSPLTPSSGDIVPQTEEGSKDIQPVNVRGVTLFIERAGKKLNEFIFSFNIDKFNVTDLTVLAEHISGDGFTEMSYQKEPYSIVWCVRSDGELAGLTYLREHQLIGWHRHTTGASGLFESVDTIPISGIDQTWVIVKRTVNGSTVRNVEYFDEMAHDGSSLWKWDRLTTDSAVVYSGVPTTTITGLDHLEGETVHALSGGALDGSHTVSGGQITLNFASTEAEVGLPFTPQATTVRPDIAGLGGETIQGKNVSWARLVVRLVDSLNGTINDTIPMEMRITDSEGDLMDESPPLFTGDVIQESIELLEDVAREGRINIKQESALPITVLGFFGELSVN